MSDRPDLHDLVGDDLPGAELDRLRGAHEALRETPPPPDVPASLDAAVLAIPGRTRGASRGRLLVAVAAAAAVAAATFGLGTWLGGSSDEVALAETATLAATPAAPSQAGMVLHVLPKDEAGNWPMTADVTGLTPLPQGAYYELWLTKNGELAVSCGRFLVDEYGSATNVWLNGPYRFRDYDRWVVVSWSPSEGTSGWLLDGPVFVPA